MNILANSGETEINISHTNENSNDMNNTGLGESSTTTSITTDEPCINRATLTDEGRLTGFFILRMFLTSVIKFLQKLK